MKVLKSQRHLGRGFEGDVERREGHREEWEQVKESRDGQGAVHSMSQIWGVLGQGCSKPGAGN